MIRPSSSAAGYSSEVQLVLKVGDRLFEVGQVLPDRCLLTDPVDVDPGPAELTISIDGRIKRRQVILRDGIRAGQREVCFE